MAPVGHFPARLGCIEVQQCCYLTVFLIYNLKFPLFCQNVRTNPTLEEPPDRCCGICLLRSSTASKNVLPRQECRKQSAGMRHSPSYDPRVAMATVSASKAIDGVGGGGLGPPACADASKSNFK